MSSPYLAEIRIVSFTFPPKGWAFCNGQILSINQNQALFSLLGTTYGGDGRTTFALPNLQGRVPIHRGDGFQLGNAAGEVAHTLLNSEMPQHTHFVNANNVAGVSDTTIPAGALLSKAPANMYGPANNMVAMKTDSISNIGGSQPHPNRQPYLVLNFCIALQGIFPSQN